MTPERFATHSLPASDQLGAWRVCFHSVFDVMPRQLVDDGFLAESRLWKLDGLAFSRVSAPAIHVVRTKAHIRRNPVDHWVITLGNRVTTAVKTDDAALQAPAGVQFVLSLGNELISERRQDDRLQLYLARDNFCEMAPMLDAARGTVLNTPLGRLLDDYMLLLERNLPDLAPEDLPRLTSAVRARSVLAVWREYGEPSAGTCARRPWGPMFSVAKWAPRGPNCTGFWKARVVWRATSSASAYRKVMRHCAMCRTPRQSRRSPRNCVSPTRQALAAPFGTNSA
jgi:hypothetical protein